MNERLKKAIAKLERLGVEYKILDLKSKALTTKDVVKLYGCPIQEICKTMVLKSDKGKIFAVTLQGDKRLDTNKMRKVVGCRKMRMLKPDELEEATGFEPGTVCPITLCDIIPLYLDESCFGTEKVNFGSGDLFYGIEINSEDLKRVVKAEIVDINTM